ncbi:MAG: hypothetical protein JSU81_05500 [Candidatus Coatesbacteria bacterium]|nr:MAG: hypothetical protein JSU81_05500 [Candidatus Coatesbacteria bacterium]
MTKTTAIVLGVYVAAAALLLALLPAAGFFSGDEGVKFIQLRSLAENGFASSAIIWRGDELGLDRRYAVVERFVELRGGELYSPHPLLFALASAPGWLLFGFRGLYLLPLLAGGTAVWLTTRLARGFGVRRPWLAGAVVAFASPLFFYSLCFWEHTAAVALWLGGFALLRRRTIPRLALAGGLWGLGAALRPEFYWLAAASVAALFVFHRGERLRTAAWPAAACAVTALGLELVIQAGWGQPAFMRLGANLAYGGPRGASGFLYAVGHSLLPLRPWYLAAAAAAVALVAALGIRWRPGVYVAAGGAGALALLYATFFAGYATALFAAFPAVFGFVFLAGAGGREAFRGASPVEQSWYAAAAAFAATLFLVVPDTSGFAWGPRFLLCVIPPAAVALARLAGGGREGRGRAAAVGVLVVLSALTQLPGLDRFASEKGARADLGAALASLPAAPLVTNKWYLPAYAAPLYLERAVILVTAEEDLSRVWSRLKGAGAPRAYFVTELPPAPAERGEYVLGLTTALAREADVADVKFLGREGRRYGLPYAVFALRLR